MFWSGLLGGDYLQVCQCEFAVVCGLQQQARAYAFDVQGVLAFVVRGGATWWQGDLQQAHVGFGFEDFQRFGGKAWCHEHFYKLFDDAFSSSFIYGAVERNDAAKGAGGVGLEGFAVGLRGICAYGYAAGVGVFDDDAGGCVGELFDAFPGGIRVGNVVVAEFFALELLRGDQAAWGGVQLAVEGGGLVWVFAIAQVLQFDEHAAGFAGVFDAAGCAFNLAGIKGHAGEVFADGHIVFSNALKRSYRQGKAGGQADGACVLQLGQGAGVLAGISEYGNVFPVFGGTAHHSRAANVDVFNRICQCAACFGYGGLKGVEIDYEQVDGGNVVLCQRCHVRGQVAPSEQAAVDFGVQGFDAAIKHFGKARVVGNFGNRQTAVCQQLGCAAS